MHLEAVDVLETTVGEGHALRRSQLGLEDDLSEMTKTEECGRSMLMQARRNVGLLRNDLDLTPLKLSKGEGNGSTTDASNETATKAVRKIEQRTSPHPVQKSSTTLCVGTPSRASTGRSHVGGGQHRHAHQAHTAVLLYDT